ncbi:MAG: phosphatidylserine decarboxylase family protein [Bacteroidaceae bacterium]|nr:phosphatidylserine decarboxylase family protein [Bacteroidaceae bacterium]
MGKRLKKLKKIRLHHEGVQPLIGSAAVLALLGLIVYYVFSSYIPLYIFLAVALMVYLVMVNFFRCPIRIFDGETEGIVVAPCDGKVVVVEEVEENEYLHRRCLMVSIFMSLFNVHANWIPVDGTVKMVEHQDGNFHRAWLPKASEENERSAIVITTPDGTDILVRQVAGAVARRIVTYAQEGDECYVDEHLGFIKFGSRVDVYLPIDSEVLVELNQKTTGNDTVIAKLHSKHEQDEKTEA